MYQKKIGLFLKELRKEKELTQSQLAEQLNVSDRTVSLILLSDSSCKPEYAAGSENIQASVRKTGSP